MTQNNEHLKVVGDYDDRRPDSQNIDHVNGRAQRDPAGPKPDQDELVQCGKCGEQYAEHFVKFRMRGGQAGWWCMAKDCDGKNIGGDINYV